MNTSSMENLQCKSIVLVVNSSNFYNIIIYFCYYNGSNTSPLNFLFEILLQPWWWLSVGEHRPPLLAAVWEGEQHTEIVWAYCSATPVLTLLLIVGQ